MLTPDFALRQTIQLKRWMGRGINADEYSSPETLKCRVNFARRRTHGGNSSVQEVVATGTIFFSAGVRVQANDVLVFDGSEYTVLNCLPSYDISGKENHVEVDVQ